MKLQLFLTATLALTTFSLFADDQTSFEVPKEILSRHMISCPRYEEGKDSYMIKQKYTLPGRFSPESSTLYILGCELYAYNTRELAYLESSGEILDVAVPEFSKADGISATTSLMGSSFDLDSLTLSTYQKARGMGDCGSSSVYKFKAEYQEFILIEAREKEDCDGDSETAWPVVYAK